MKKIIILALLPFLGMAQSFQKKQVDLNIGLGLGNTFIHSGPTSTFPPLSASLDVGVTDNISIGGILAFTSATWKYSGNDWCNQGNGNGGWYYYNDTYRWSYYIFGLRGAFHFGEFIKNDKLDVYAGLMLGDIYARYTYTTTSPCPDKHAYFYDQYQGGFFLGGYAGCRYRFTDKVGVFGELGYGLAYLTLGVNFKLQ